MQNQGRPENWSNGMSYELSNFNIVIKTLVPGYMQTNFVKNGEFASHPEYKADFDKYFQNLKQSQDRWQMILRILEKNNHIILRETTLEMKSSG